VAPASQAWKAPCAAAQTAQPARFRTTGSRSQPRLRPRAGARASPLCLCEQEVNHRQLATAASASCGRLICPGRKGLPMALISSRSKAKHCRAAGTGPQPHLGCCRPRILLLFWPQRRGQDPPGHSHHKAMIEQDQNPAVPSRPPLWCSCCRRPKAAYELPAVIQKLDRYALLVIDEHQATCAAKELEPRCCFELICHPELRTPPLLGPPTTFREWDTIFPSGSHDRRAAVDRLCHHCHIVGNQGRATDQNRTAARVSSDSSDRLCKLTAAGTCRAGINGRSNPSSARNRRAKHEKLAHQAFEIARRAPNNLIDRHATAWSMIP